MRHWRDDRFRHVNHGRQAAALAAILLVASIVFSAAPAAARRIEAPIIPTVHPVLTPSTALSVPLSISADSSDVWQSRRGNERMLLRGHVVVHLAYRTLRARRAVAWLKPADTGVPMYDLTLFLKGHVRIAEGAKHATVTTARRLLVTAQVMHSVRLSGGVPVGRNMDKSPLVLAGEKLRRQVARRRVPLPFIPTVTVRRTELALQKGWIARGPGNSIIFGPGQTLPRTGRVLVRSTVAIPARPAKAPPMVFATGDTLSERVMDGQRVTIVHGSFYMIRQTRDGKPPLQMHAEDAVLFSPLRGGAAGTRPVAGRLSRVTRVVTGVYLRGDVSITYGSQTVRASRIFYDFVHNQAIMLHAVLSARDATLKVPLYMRAKKLLQTARGEFVARKATLSTDEFYTPHYGIKASEIVMRDITPRGISGARTGPATYAVAARNVTLNAENVPFFYLPYVGLTTSQNTTPLRRIQVGNSSIYGPELRTTWDLFGLAGQRAPKGLTANLNADYFSNRGPAGGVGARWAYSGASGYLRSFIMNDTGTDLLGRTRTNVPLSQSLRGRIIVRHTQQLADGWELQLQGSYISDPNFLEQYFPVEYAVGSQHETSAYLRHVDDTEAITLLAKRNLNNFVSNADREDNEFTVNKEPEFNYRRIGDSPFNIFTYYSDTKAGLVQDAFSRTTPAVRGLQANFPNMSANQQFVSYYLDRGWTNSAIARADTRQELDLPIAVGDGKVVPYVIGRYTYWDARFPTGQSTGGGTSRVWGAAGMRASIAFWKTYNNVHSKFFGVDGLRHIVRPEVNVFVSGTNVQQGNLQPYNTNVEGITDASGAEFALRQKLQTKRGKPGKRYTVDWMTFNVSADMFWHQSPVGPFSSNNPMYAGGPFSTANYSPSLIGIFDNSRPELSIPTDSVNADGSWRIGNFTRFLADQSYNVDRAELERADGGIAIDQSPSLSYFVGNRYIQGVSSDQWTFAIVDHITRKYVLSATQSYDFYLGHNILSTVTLVRHFPRLFVSLTVGYDADTKNTAVLVNLWPEGLRPPTQTAAGLLGLPG